MFVSFSQSVSLILVTQIFAQKGGLNNEDKLVKILERCPNFVKSGWQSCVQEIRALEREPTVEDVWSLIRMISKEKNDPVLGGIMDNVNREQSLQNSRSRRPNAVNVQPNFYFSARCKQKKACTIPGYDLHHKHLTSIHDSVIAYEQRHKDEWRKHMQTDSTQNIENFVGVTRCDDQGRVNNGLPIVPLQLTSHHFPSLELTALALSWSREEDVLLRGFE